MSSRTAILGPLGRALRARRTELGLTLQALSRRARVSPRFLAQLEAGQGNISVVRLSDVALALGTSAARLLDQAGTPDRAAVVALLGLRGAGKSTLGPLLARRLGARFVELDQRVEQAAGMSLSEVFELHGESFYRRLERDALRELVAERAVQPSSPGDSGVRTVVATGGSLVTDPETFELVRRETTTVWLQARPEDHMLRVVAQGDRRPLRDRADAMSELEALLRARRHLYAQADHAVDTSAQSPDAAVAAIAAALGSERAGSARGITT